MRLPRLIAILSVWGTFAFVGWAGSQLWRRTESMAPDAVLEQWALPPTSELRAFVQWVANRDARKSVYLGTPEPAVRVTLAEVGFSLDVQETFERTRNAPRPQSMWERVSRVVSGPPLKPYVVDAIFVFDGNEARRTLRRIEPLVNRNPINARLDLEHHLRIEHEPGREIDIPATLSALEHTLPDEGDVVPLQFRSIPASVESNQLPTVDVTSVLSNYETSFLHRAGARAVNIARGAHLLNGFILQPHATFSFNQTVGPRLQTRGFIDAPVIVNDEIDKGVGGGICQVASTLYAAAVYAGLPIVERRSHSRPSGYAPLGLDATVIDGKVDLRFSNPYDQPLLIHAFLPTKTSIRVEILGRAPEWKVEHTAQVIKRHPFLRRIVEKQELTPGEFKRSQKGSFGYDIVSVVRYTDASGAVTSHHYKSNYYPVPEVFWVGPGTPLTSLPPLPDGAEGLEDRD
jgi:vancomycin resistance protein YoaR